MASVAVDLGNTLADRPPVFERWLSDFIREHGIAEADIRGAAAIGARGVWPSRGRQWSLADLHPFATATTFTAAVDGVLASAD